MKTTTWKTEPTIEVESPSIDLIHDKLKEVFDIAYYITEWRWQLWSTDQWLPQQISNDFVEECMKLLKLK